MINSNKGFTLIELLIVIAIIGILAGAVVVTLQGNTSDAEEKVTNLNVVQVARAVAISESTGTIGEFECPAGVTELDYVASGGTPLFSAATDLAEGVTYCRVDNTDGAGSSGNENDNNTGDTKRWVVFEYYGADSLYCQDNTEGAAKQKASGTAIDVGDPPTVASLGGEECDDL